MVSKIDLLVDCTKSFAKIHENRKKARHLLRMEESINPEKKTNSRLWSYIGLCKKRMG